MKLEIGSIAYYYYFLYSEYIEIQNDFHSNSNVV